MPSAVQLVKDDKTGKISLSGAGRRSGALVELVKQYNQLVDEANQLKTTGHKADKDKALAQQQEILEHRHAEALKELEARLRAKHETDLAEQQAKHEEAKAGFERAHQANQETITYWALKAKMLEATDRTRYLLGEIFNEEIVKAPLPLDFNEHHLFAMLTVTVNRADVDNPQSDRPLVFKIHHGSEGHWLEFSTTGDHSPALRPQHVELDSDGTLPEDSYKHLLFCLHLLEWEHLLHSVRLGLIGDFRLGQLFDNNTVLAVRARMADTRPMAERLLEVFQNAGFSSGEVGTTDGRSIGYGDEFGTTSNSFHSWQTMEPGSREGGTFRNLIVDEGHRMLSDITSTATSDGPGRIHPHGDVDLSHSADEHGAGNGEHPGDFHAAADTTPSQADDNSSNCD